jgi:hypothetical protein
LTDRCEQSVVRSDKLASVGGFHSDVAIAADGRIDHREYAGVLPNVRERIGEDERTGADIERWNAVREVDDRARRRDSAHHRVADPDPLVSIAEIGEEDDRTGRPSRGHHEKLRGPLDADANGVDA